jgi:hypothetical protein
MSPLVDLVFSMNSLRVNGIEGFEYPATTLLPTFALLFSVLAVKRGMDQ